MGSSAISRSGRADHGARDGDALLFAARKRGGLGLHAFAEPDPGQQFPDIAGVIGLVPSGQAQRQSDIFKCREMVQQAEILKHHADSPADGRKIAAPGGGHVLPEQGDQAPAGRLGDVNQLQKRGFARARQAGQKGKGARLQDEGDVAQDLGPGAVAHADIFKTNHEAPTLALAPRRYHVFCLAVPAPCDGKGFAPIFGHMEQPKASA